MGASDHWNQQSSWGRRQEMGVLHLAVGWSCMARPVHPHQYLSPAHRSCGAGLGIPHTQAQRVHAALGGGSPCMAHMTNGGERGSILPADSRPLYQAPRLLGPFHGSRVIGANPGPASGPAHKNSPARSCSESLPHEHRVRETLRPGRIQSRAGIRTRRPDFQPHPLTKSQVRPLPAPRDHRTPDRTVPPLHTPAQQSDHCTKGGENRSQQGRYGRS